MRRLFTFVVVAVSTASGLLWWLHEGDMDAILEDGKVTLARWDADGLARDAGVTASPDPALPLPAVEAEAPAEGSD